jgi:sugar O-acyltransferase (sialic acid O-acetyltransferase NeuD family)
MRDVRKLILVGGAGTSADVLAIIGSINQVTPRYQVLGLLDDALTEGSLRYGVPVLGGVSDGAHCAPDAWFVDCLGSPRSYLRRESLLVQRGFDLSRFETLIHPSVVLAADAQVGSGCVLFPHVVVLANVRIGQHVTVLSGSVLNHDVRLGDWSILASGVMLSGAVSVGRACYLGAASAVREGVTIGDGTLVGMGSAVIHDIDAGLVVAGVPARVLRNAK